MFLDSSHEWCSHDATGAGATSASVYNSGGVAATDPLVLVVCAAAAGASNGTAEVYEDDGWSTGWVMSRPLSLSAN